MSTQTLNTIGLLLGILGVIFLFKWGPPQPDLNTGVSLGLEDATVIDQSTGKTVADHNREVLERRKLHSRLSRIGLILIMIGFGFQLWAVWVPFKSGLNKKEGKTIETSLQMPGRETVNGIKQ